MKFRALAAAAMLMCLAACGETSNPAAVHQPAAQASSPIYTESYAVTRERSKPVIECDTDKPDDTEDQAWTSDELQAIAKTLAGECYDDQEQDKRWVCEVILNRVSDGRFGDSVVEVLSAENQFSGYWVQSRPISDNDYEIAEQALRDWYAGGCEPLSPYLFFCAGDGFVNEFRSEY